MRINDPNLLKQVVNYLDRHQEAVRIKKMLYCLCTSRWEKDIDYLNSINFQYLIEQLVRENTTLERFRILLQNLIKTVNKPKQYIDIAKVIYLSIGQLYPEFRQEHGGRPQQTPPPAAPIPQSEPIDSSLSPVPSAIQRAYTPEPTQAVSQPGGVPSALQRAYAPMPTQAFTSQVVPSALQRAYAPLATQQFETQTPIDDDVDESAYETYYNPELSEEGQFENGDLSSQYEDGGQADSWSVPEYDPFSLRQNVMSYTNPLRAKIILLVMLRPNFNFGSQSVVQMREHQLDDLLSEVLKTYPTMAQLEESMTYAVEQLVELEEYGKAANGLLQSLIPLYTVKSRV
ncbi:hypothetical protein [Chamaesiphon minutus]|uniref:Uncharacterized protein n=1 Tax=Chamaesiphon minutus (strain ATCC 27169 / PCC 6605) TaxID=1173020 RepID=K9UGZ9_CHAP6|nr:hypothetical protein [Chamaesiphon minutus]AFY93716.1 hypothetical protein Cha6605_2674 [Chamaesiphon minutus PCC 6605]